MLRSRMDQWEDLGKMVSSVITSEPASQKILDRFFKFEFNESLAYLKTGMSQEDKKALSVFEKSVHLKDGYYEVEIPWKNYPPFFPNN